MMQYPSIAGDKLFDVLRLIRTLNVGPVTFFQLMQRFGTASAALDALPDLSLRGGRRSALTACPAEQAEREIKATEKFGARMVLYGAPDYPKLLTALHDAPPVITVSGNAQLWQNRDSIAIVGSRNASANGCQIAQKFARELADSGMIVTSGLARGIDSFAHKGALAAGTVAVIAGGIDNIYPPENAPLYAQIREAGAIISEQPFGSLPYSGSFPGRNRIIAGMSLGTVVVEASPKSGSLITARFALENNREVFAVPGSPLDPRSKGCNQLIRQGASLAESTGDIIQGVSHMRARLFEETNQRRFAFMEHIQTYDDGTLDNARQHVIQKLGVTPVAVDVLIEQCEASAQNVATILLELELAGRLRRSSGGKVSLAEIEDVSEVA
jgi:DNA processing protein